MAGVREVLGVDPLKVAKDLVASRADKDRRAEYGKRVDLLLDDSMKSIGDLAATQFKALEVVNALREVAPISGVLSLMRRVASEISRPVYSTPPTREVKPKASGEVYAEIARKTRLNERLDLACFLAVGTNTLQLHPRWTKRLGPVLDVLTPDNYRVIVDPDDPTRELAVIYDSAVIDANGGKDTIYTYWDDTEAFRWRASGKAELIEGRDGTPVATLTEASGHPGVLPFVAVHARERWGSYWDLQTGKALVAASEYVDLLMALTLNLHKTQGFKQFVAQGATAAMVRDQALSESGVLILPEGVTLALMDLATDAQHYRDTVEFVVQHVAANHGINRERMNQENKQVADHVGLLERRAEAIRIFRDVELRLFDLFKIISRGKGELALDEKATLEIDFAEISHKVDREALLRIRKEEKSQGLRSTVDDTLEDEPELEGDRKKAMERIDRNMDEEAVVIKRRRELNIPADATADEPGQSPEQNGAMGPPVRDGKMSKDDAAEQARTGPPPTATKH